MLKHHEQIPFLYYAIIYIKPGWVDMISKKFCIKFEVSGKYIYDLVFINNHNKIIFAQKNFFVSKQSFIKTTFLWIAWQLNCKNKVQWKIIFPQVLEMTNKSSLDLWLQQQNISNQKQTYFYIEKSDTTDFTWQFPLLLRISPRCAWLPNFFRFSPEFESNFLKIVYSLPYF